ncbi:hypothetical protein [Corynebacterium sp. HS2168-gen11]|uniref:hypothetical protein n=1 Tax=Corynebacterium sp. HS2168-gen11 TaxID=2974027 RepID=UPI00216B2897|nr:hypothetical protein [Corynebacterium sp. HS2168-gen11]MCS4535781.1 hypothetical protein [Corynebacterium sp. HS2168-gen11]
MGLRRKALIVLSVTSVLGLGIQSPAAEAQETAAQNVAMAATETSAAPAAAAPNSAAQGPEKDSIPESDEFVLMRPMQDGGSSVGSVVVPIIVTAAVVAIFGLIAHIAGWLKPPAPAAPPVPMGVPGIPKLPASVVPLKVGPPVPAG